MTREVLSGNHEIEDDIFSHQAERDLAALSADARSVVRSGLYNYATQGIGDTKRLRGSHFHRLRIGRYRVIFAEDTRRLHRQARNDDLQAGTHVMGEPQIIRTPSGDEMVIVPRADYEALRAAAEEALEDAEDLAIAQSRWEEWNASGRLTTPPDVARMVMEGSRILEAFRRQRGVSLDDLATRTGVESSRIEAIEARETIGDAQTMSKLADGLGIDKAWLVPSHAGADE